MDRRSLVAASLAGVLLIGGSAAVSAQDDPSALLAQSLQATTTASSFHFKATADGPLNLGDMLGGTALPIDGTNAEGDVNVTGQQAQLTFAVPISGLNISGGLIYPNDGALYVKLALPMASASDLWHKIPLTDVVPGSSTAPSMPPVATIAQDLQDALTKSGATLTNEGDTPCQAGTCTKLHLEIPATALDSGIDAVAGASVAPSAAATAPIPVDILIDKASSRIDSVAVEYADTTNGTDVKLNIQLSNYDTPVTVTAPPADQITDAPLIPGM